MQTRRPLLRILPLIAAAGLLSLGMGKIPGKWKLPDGGQLVRKPPKGSGLTVALFHNNGPDEVTLSSKGTTVTNVLVVQPDGVLVKFPIAEGGKNVVILDPDLDGNGAKGKLFWGKWSPREQYPGGPGGTGNE